ncbi:cytochrome P450 [Artemisia annua]|uniref:Cytochrome P450 n=1 Tax=Artemisia annua TaxID=35608 RepID=A0A2U1QLA3_ARTAN|nr:cytochrome P450 [Artemisia annua]
MLVKCISEIRLRGDVKKDLISHLGKYYLLFKADLLSSSPTQTKVIHRLGARKTIVTANPQNVEYILKTNFVNFPKGKPFTEILNDFLGCGIFNVDGDLWHAQRFDPCCLGDQDSLYKVVPILTAFDMAAEISAKRATTPVAATWKLKKLFGVGMIVSGLSEDMIRDMMISFIMAGKDTTSAAMTWIFYAISQHGNVEKHLVNEIISHFNDEQCDSLQEMKYLHACICEIMRLYPPVARDSKHATDADVLPDGTKVMAGDRVTYFPYGMGRMESIWGENRLDFSPNRWLDNEPENKLGENLGLLKEVSPCKYPVFQAGPRICLGKGMANVQMIYVVASIMNRFEIIPVRTGFEPVYLPLLTAHMYGGFKVLIRRRPV